MVVTIPSGGVKSLNIAWQNNLVESGYWTDRVAFASVTAWDASIAVSDISEYTADLTALPTGTNSFVFCINSTPSSGADATTFGDITITFS
jgi:hypothetical protein